VKLFNIFWQIIKSWKRLFKHFHGSPIGKDSIP